MTKQIENILEVLEEKFKFMENEMNKVNINLKIIFIFNFRKLNRKKIILLKKFINLKMKIKNMKKKLNNLMKK
jgi:hypothetical protein